MITDRTVLVLGAGASIPYGFPSGEALINEIVEGIDSGRFRERLDRLFPVDTVLRFTRDLKSACPASIDEFLRTRTDYRDLGKMLIAMVISRYENPGAIFPAKRNWLKEIWNSLVTHPDDLIRSHLKVVTFNYDRLIEHFFYNALVSRFNMPDMESRRHLGSLDVIHVHGQIGLLPCQTTIENRIQPIRQYLNEAITNDVELDRLRQMIKIVHEEPTSTGHYARATQNIADAKNIYFIGFGFHQANLDLLKIDWKAPGKIFKGTAYGLSRIKFNQLRERLPNIQFADPSVDCLQFFTDVIGDPAHDQGPSIRAITGSPIGPQ